MHEHRNRHEIRHRTQTPDGRRVEVLYAPLPPAATAAGAARHASTGDSAPPARTQDGGAARAKEAVRAPRDGAATGTDRAPALHVCAGCGGERVHPLDWIEHSPERWAIVLRCPDCQRTRDGVFGRDMVERLDDELDRASAALLSDYRRLVHANMSEEIERFSRALQLDLIGAADFSPAQR